MKIKRMRLISIGLLIAMLCSCGQTNTKAHQEDAAQAPMDITISFWNVSDHLVDDALQKFVEKKFSINFVPINVNYDDYAQQLQQLAASDNLPDIFANDLQGTSTYANWAQQEKIRSVPKDLSAYPNLEKYLDTDYNKQFRLNNDTYYMIPRVTYSDESMWALDRCIVVRKDWMQKLGLSEPQSWEDFEAALRAFVEQDPDGNGENDTQGLVSSHLNTFEALYLNSFPELSNTERGWLFENEQWLPSYASTRTGPALAKIQHLYQKGLIDPNFAYYSTAEALNAFATGKAGAITSQYYAVIQFLMENGYQDKIRNIVQILPTWSADDGSRYRFTTSLHWSESYFGASVNDEKMQRICALYDWLLSDEYARIREYGVEGIDWEEQDGKPVRLHEATVSTDRLYPSQSIFNCLVNWNQENQYKETEENELHYSKDGLEMGRTMLQWFQENTMRVNYNFDVIFMSLDSKNSLIYNKEVQDEMVKVIMGDEDAAVAWPKVLERLKNTTTLTQAIQDVTAEAQKRGIHP